jgi:very-short-patch-repair endonuclease
VLPGADVLRVPLSAAEVDGVATSLSRTALDCARRLPLPDAVAVCDSAVQPGLDLELLTRRPGALRGPGAGAARRAVGLVDPRCQSCIETCVRLVLTELAVPFRSQVSIAGVGRVDFLVGERLVVEVDGFAFHRGRADYREDRRHTNALVALGYRVLRFTYEDAVHHPERVEALVRAAMRHAAA